MEFKAFIGGVWGWEAADAADDDDKDDDDNDENDDDNDARNGPDRVFASILTLGPILTTVSGFLSSTSLSNGVGDFGLSPPSPPSSSSTS